MRVLRERGILDARGSRVKKILERENYYNLVNGYKTLFLDSIRTTPSNDVYKSNTSFDEIYSLYLFDREIRNIFLKYLLEIENNIKSELSHDFSKKYGHDNYLKIDNFNTTVHPKERNKTQAQKVGEVQSLIANIQNDISRQLSKNNDMISHHMLKYGYVPLWVLVNTLTMGTISIFYTHMKETDQNDIGRKFKLFPDEMKSILSVLTVYRNACAHDERLYNKKALKKSGHPNSIKNNQYHNLLGITIGGDGNPICGKNDLFSVVIIIKIMLSKTSFNKFYHSIKNEIEKLDRQLNTISINDVTNEMGFPANWKRLKDF